MFLFHFRVGTFKNLCVISIKESKNLIVFDERKSESLFETMLLDNEESRFRGALCIKRKSRNHAIF